MLTPQPSAVDFVVSIPPSTVGAPQETKAIELPGTFFRIVSANAAFTLRIDSQSGVQLHSGDLYRCPGDTFFRRLVIINASTTDTLAVTITVGQGDFSASNGAQIPWATRIIGQAAASLAGVTTLALPGTPSGNLVQRASVQVSNEDPNLSLELWDQSGNRVLVVFPLTSAERPLSGYIAVRNPNGAAIACAISETWYYNP